MKEENALIIFARYPDGHTVKTRLSPVLSPFERGTLYETLIDNTVHIANKIKDWTAFIAYTPEGKGKFFEDRYGLTVFAQGGKDLGFRMYNAISKKLSEGFKKAIIVGTDIPDLDETIIMSAFLALDLSDVVLGPAADGGYYLIGMKQKVPDIFTDIRWSTDSVLLETLNKIKNKGMTVLFLKTLQDIDRPKDLENYKKHV